MLNHLCADSYYADLLRVEAQGSENMGAHPLADHPPAACPPHPRAAPLAEALPREILGSDFATPGGHPDRSRTRAAPRPPVENSENRSSSRSLMHRRKVAVTGAGIVRLRN